MYYISKYDIAGIITNYRKRIHEEHVLFLLFVVDFLQDGKVIPYDFSEQIKRCARDLHYGNKKSGEPISHPLAKHPYLEDMEDFYARIKETILQIFPEEFAKQVVIFLPGRVRNRIRQTKSSA